MVNKVRDHRFVPIEEIRGLHTVMSRYQHAGEKGQHKERW